MRDAAVADNAEAVVLVIVVGVLKIESTEEQSSDLGGAVISVFGGEPKAELLQATFVAIVEVGSTFGVEEKKLKKLIVAEGIDGLAEGGLEKK